MKRRHFENLRPFCPACAAAGRQASPLIIAEVEKGSDADVEQGILHCPNPACSLEFPIIDFVPIITADPGSVVAQQLSAISARAPLGPRLTSLIADAAGPGGAWDVARQHLSTYLWDAYAAEDPAEAEGRHRPGAVRRCVAALLDLAAPIPAGPCLDLGCAVGGSSVALATARDEIVLGVDLNFGFLRSAQEICHGGTVSYDRRRIGLVYDRRRFPVTLPPADRVDFWCCDALAPPFAPGSFAAVAALNLIDCLAAPASLLPVAERLLALGGKLLLSTPYDWSGAVTDPRAWIGGHSQRGRYAGAAEPLIRDLLTPGAHPAAARSLRLFAERQDFPWHTRLHDRSAVAYDTHLVVAERIDLSGS